jgi:hypothetical protein
LIACIRPRSLAAADAVFESLTRLGVRGRAWNGAELRARRDGWCRRGIAVSRRELDALGVAGAALLVPQSQETRVLNEGADPLKVF